MVTGDICVKAYTPSTVFMFKLATSNNFVLLLDDKIASLLSVVMPRSRCTCKHKRGWEVLRKRGVRNKQVSLSLSRTVIPDTLKRCVEIIKHKQNTVSQVCVNIPIEVVAWKPGCSTSKQWRNAGKTLLHYVHGLCCTHTDIHTNTCTYIQMFLSFCRIGEKVRSATHPSR